MKGELAVALEKGVGGRGSLCHISACLMELYFFLLEHINTELSQSRHHHPQLGLLSPFLAHEISNRCAKA